MFNSLHAFLQAIQRLDIDEVLREVWQMEDVQEYIVHLNTVEQLYNKGEDAKGNSLGTYSPKTIPIKKKKGQPYDRVTLRDTGRYYATHEVVNINLNGFSIDSNPIKGKTDLTEVYGEDIVGLSDASKADLAFFIKSRVTYEIARRLKGPREP